VNSDTELMFPLSPLQHGMVVHHLQGGDRGVDVEQVVIGVEAAIDAGALESAWVLVASRHPILRTRFVWEGVERPMQEVLAEVTVPFESRRVGSLDEFLREDRLRGIALDQAPLFRVTLLDGTSPASAERGRNQTPGERKMVWTYSHAILDSVYAFILREVFEACEAKQRGEAVIEPPPRPAYKNHIDWLSTHLTENAGAAKAFFREKLAGFVTPTSLDAVRIPPVRAPQVETYERHRIRLDRASSDGLHGLAETHGLRRPIAFVEAAWSLTLAAFSGDEDVIFGSTRACRRSSVEGAEQMMGLFINTVPVRAKVPPEKPLLELVRELRAQQTELRAFEHTPLADVMACADIARGTPLFDTIIVFNEQEHSARFAGFGEAWRTRSVDTFHQTNFALTLLAYDGPEMAFTFSYDPKKFSADTIERVASLFQANLAAMAARPDAALGELPRMPAADAGVLFGAWNATEAAIPPPHTIHEAFEAQVDRTPDAVAAVFRGDSMTYRELDRRANALAHELQKRGAGPDKMVGVFVDRSLEMLVALFGILKAGAAYVPMDPTYPTNRIAWMLEDTHAEIVVSTAALSASLPESRATVVCVETLGASSERPRSGAGGENLAYVIFTSGSTGRPKGVMIEHRNVANFCLAMDQKLGTTPGVWLAVTSISFDISVLELFWTLSRGFTVVVQEEAVRLERGGRVSRASAKPMEFSLFYFAAEAAGGDKYRLLLEGAKFADTHDFAAVWTPERHFHPFGGLYPNPSLTSAAIAVVTKRIGIRAGSVVLPLHNPIRVAEEWSVVDNLSNGRVGLSFASGWHAADFALLPENFKTRREVMARSIETVLALWRGDSIETTGGDGRPVELKLYPPPVQRAPKIWITASTSPETFAMAGRTGACILTNLLVMKREELMANVAIYRKAWAEAGHAGEGHVTLMLHTYVGRDMDEVRAKVREPFLEYLRTSTDLIAKTRWELTNFAKGDDRKAQTGPADKELGDLSKEEMDAILGHAFERYFKTAGLFGTPDSCIDTVEELKGLGVNEIACLIDFGVDTDDVLGSLRQLDELRRLTNPAAAEAAPVADEPIASKIRKHRVTHLQCTPSLASTLVTDDDALGAVSELEMLLLGGEALPASLVDRLRTRFRGVINNMYGPTEATVWSTMSPIADAASITIGKPIANTTVYVVDRHLRALPVGVPGELVIGGLGVVRGYLEREELTRERFVRDPYGKDGSRLYRTGDLARWGAGGDIEFLGRLDHQVKVSGYRIELGEIETLLSEHPAVREAVVVARSDGGGDARLVGYVIPREGASAGGATDAWHAIWNETYTQGGTGDGALNTVGWRSTYTGEQIPEEEMREWVDMTTERILSLSPRRVMEIGCGTGMLLLRIAPRVDHYTGVDFSQAALDHVRREADARGLGDVVSLSRRAADTVGEVEGQFDTIVINSVIQYFPDVDYLVRVIEAAWAKLSPGGALFVGDVRSLPQLRAFATAIELARAPSSTPQADLAKRVERRITEDSELVVDPALFSALGTRLANVADVRVELKAGRAMNEMSRFRCDVTVRKGPWQGAGDAARRVRASEPCSLESLRALLQEQPGAVRVTDIPNLRLSREVAAANALSSPGAGTAAELAALEAHGIDPEDVRTIDSGYEVRIHWSEAADRFDATFLRRGAAHELTPPSAPTSADFRALANRPAQRAAASGDAWIPELRRHLREKLPEYMVPGAFVVLDAFPLTPNGKIDRKALPAPDRGRHEAGTEYVAPENELEQSIAAIFQELLGIDEVSIDGKFLDLGANSLMLVRVSSRLGAALGRTVSLVQLFQFPTIRQLAAALGSSDDGAAAKQGHERAQARKDALARRQAARQRPR
jgi:natural product biosynthesis luciferase-like monooxygenase protein